MTQLEHSNNKILGNKLYVALEDSMDESIDPKGAVVVFDISQGLQQPKLIKTLTAGNGLPADFQLGHALYPTSDGKYVLVQSWNSGHLVKIDTSNDQVIKVFDKQNSGFVLPHGGFVVGQIR